jgi:uncharacterized membrane protein
MQYVELVTRWLHIVAGVIWIGHLYFFNFVNANFAPTMDGETKKKVVPQLMPRALFMFRWGAAWTWITGLMLLFLVYYHGYQGSNLVDMATRTEKVGAMTWLPGLGGVLLGFLVYDLLFKALAKQHNVAVALWGLFAVGFGWMLLEMLGYSQRAAYIHVGAMFGTAMAANVWMRIWPAQRRIITATKEGKAPDAADPALAGLRSKHNTYMSVPLLLLMLLPDQIGKVADLPYLAVMPGILAVAFGATWWLYGKAKTVQGF